MQTNLSQLPLIASCRAVGASDRPRPKEGKSLNANRSLSDTAQHGIDYVVFDKESSPRDRNWGVTIAWSHPFLAQLLPEDLFNRLSECQPDPALDSKKAGCEGVLIRDGATGETIAQPPFPGVRRLNIQKTRTLWSKDINVKVSMVCQLSRTEPDH